MIKKHVTKIRYIMIILCLLILVWAAGKTFETDRGLWMGYKWYPIASSDKVKRKIPYGSASVEQMTKIKDYIDKYSSKSYWAPGEKENSIVKINRIASIEGFRKFLYGGQPCLYCVYENQSGGRMFVTFEPFIDMKYEASSIFYFEKKLSVEDVNKIKNVSDREEVFAIDPIVNSKIGSLLDEEYLENSSQQSVHITDNGYITARYDKNGNVIEVLEYEDAKIRMILEMEQKGITVNLYDVPEDLMPEDARVYLPWNKIS